MQQRVQLPLGVQLNDDDTLASFYPGKNAPLLAHLKQLLSFSPIEHYLYLWGEEGVGRTHLLQAACNQATEQQLSAFYTPLDNAFQSPTILHGLEQLDLICLDNIHAVLGDAAWEEGLFHFFNRVRDAKKRLLISGNAAPRHLSVKLPDLQSRLSWGTIFQVQPLDDDEKLSALQLRAKARGMVLSDEAGRFLIRRSVRDMRGLYQTLETLDTASLSAQRRLTIPFLKEVLAL